MEDILMQRVKLFIFS